MRLVRLLRLLAVPSACMAPTGCDGDAAEPSRTLRIGCTAEARPGLAVEPRDAVSGANLAAGSTLIVRQGSVLVDFGVGGPFPFLTAAYERPGVYSVTVRRAGYRVWTAENVAVTKDDCHVVTVRLEPDLQRE